MGKSREKEFLDYVEEKESDLKLACLMLSSHSEEETEQVTGEAEDVDARHQV